MPYNSLDPFLITLEGIDGSGKTTLAEYVAKELLPSLTNKEVVLTHEPGGTELGNQIYKMLCTQHTKLDPLTESLLFAAARSEHVTKLINPSLLAGKYVVCDRFLDSTYVYQYTQGISRFSLLSFEPLSRGNLRPDLTLLLDLPAEVAVKRASGKAYSVAFLKEARSHYLERARQDPSRIKVINAELNLDAVKVIANEHLKKAIAALEKA